MFRDVSRLFRVSMAYGLIAMMAAFLAAAPSWAQSNNTFDEQAILRESKAFFGDMSEGLADVVKKVFAEQGKPSGYIAGEEFSGAIGIGLRYGKGTLHRKDGETRPVFWQGPSIGFDFGANAAKVFILVYNMNNSDEIYQRIPGVEGSLYLVAGVGVNYQQSGDLLLAPIRTGVGLRGGINVGYLHYGRQHSWLPF